MTFSLHGQAVSGGIAIGRAHLVSHARFEVAQYQLRERDVVGELIRFDKAVAIARAELDALRSEASVPGAPAELSAFVDLHAMILADPALTEAARDLIRDRRCNAEWALVQQMQQAVDQFDEFEDAYLRERKQDIVQVVERVLKVLQGKARKLSRRKTVAADVELIVVANDLSPADTIQFKSLKIGGFVTDLGGATSHTAIVARSLAIPAVVGMQHARPLIQDDDLLIVDGTRGVLIVDPDAGVLQEYRFRKTELELERSKLKRLVTGRSRTLDGEEIELHANIELPQDAESARDVGADGVGLFRTEFLFMNRDELPGEDEQFEAYRSVVKALAGKPVTIRTLDIGADKEARALRDRAGNRAAPNPALGLRAIRFCLAEPQLFLAQLRAILRASHYGKVRLLIPMLAHAVEIEQTLSLIELAKMQLRESRHKFDMLEVGGMIEIPAAALSLGPFLRRLDFLSIGTNDLIQYTLAIDRTDGSVAHLYDPLHPAVLKLISQTIQSAQRVGMPVAVCGEMAGDPKLTKLLLGMGLRQFSMHPTQLLEVKQQVMMSDATQLAVRVARLLKLDEPEKISEQLERL
ncbi:phosphoenolpyruvate--protein phosphotransferase [Sulfuritalea hydrogenivorans]|uniref:Phosphoenolpyruvate-protein phosphotransferase n=1 Tax=Sulfuritalea hydrogenivorans sk43H TaxID=1223802 RepID=W0SKE4_9PROT|nr:phosphoenolpyruvate--protein phosphotransferase [Sulfuritalea hydrogenivorans]MDK9716002.1 phosphoenolpyruvate--protein phosphotransferase [Sulfuritalea sp.]BAO31280.1 phosphoenolpyruvate-protein phosphotransferase [Sulfuritalea hydrogenivorans sk43H]